MLPENARRINIIGASGTGKSTLARQLAEVYKLPIVYMDYIAHTKRYNPLYDQPAFLKKIHEECMKNEWIMEGVYASSTLQNRMEKADVTLYLDYPRRIYLFRVFKRRIQYRNKSREEMPTDWKERLDFNFIKYVWNFKKVKKPIIDEELAKNPHSNIIILKQPKDTKKLLKSTKRM